MWKIRGANDQQISHEQLFRFPKCTGTVNYWGFGSWAHGAGQLLDCIYLTRGDFPVPNFLVPCRCLVVLSLFDCLATIYFYIAVFCASNNLFEMIEIRPLIDDEYLVVVYRISERKPFSASFVILGVRTQENDIW